VVIAVVVATGITASGDREILSLRVGESDADHRGEPAAGVTLEA
jgi:transposase-like protein